MDYVRFVGIDVSKATLDVAVLDEKGLREDIRVVANDMGSLKRFFRELRKDGRATLFCLEPTGHYSNLTVGVLLEMGLPVWVANPVDIRDSIGMRRGKNDRTDALRIAEYALRFRDRARPAHAGDMDRMALQQLLSQRGLLVGDRAKYMAQMHDYADRIDKGSYAVIKKINARLIKELDKAIGEIERRLHEMITAIPEMARQYGLLKTVTGVGNVLALTLVVSTNGFSRFDSPRALACHAGVAPFEYRSGTSVRGRKRVSHRADKRLKTLLHMAALAAIRSKGELGIYYQKKVAEGKNKMSVINAVRNKIIYRIFAVLKRNSEYRLLVT